MQSLEVIESFIRREIMPHATDDCPTGNIAILAWIDHRNEIEDGIVEIEALTEFLDGPQQVFISEARKLIEDRHTTTKPHPFFTAVLVMPEFIMEWYEISAFLPHYVIDLEKQILLCRFGYPNRPAPNSFWQTALNLGDDTDDGNDEFNAL